MRLCFRVIDDVPEKKGMDLCKQMSSKCSLSCICGIFLPLNPSTTTVYARSAFYPSLCFTLSLQSAFYTQSAFYPWSAVRSLRLTLTGQKPVKYQSKEEEVVRNAFISLLACRHAGRNARRHAVNHSKLRTQAGSRRPNLCNELCNCACFQGYISDAL